MLKSGSGTTNVFSGDGTTTSVILTRELVREGIKAIEYGMHPIDLKIGMNAAVDTIIEELKKMTKKIEGGKEGIFKVAMIATNYDQKISQVLSEGLTNLGKDGSFSFDESPGSETFIDVLPSFFP